MTSDDPEVLREIARQGDRKHLLWELAANGRDFCGVEFTRQEAGLEGASREEAVENFIEAVDLHLDQTRGPDWDRLEERHGDRADQIEAQVDGGA